MDRYNNTAIVFGDLKGALLHFEYIIPINMSGYCLGFHPSPHGVVEDKKLTHDNRSQILTELDDSFPNPEKLMKLFPPHLANNPEFEVIRNMFDGLMFSYMVKATRGQEVYEQYIQQLAENLKIDQTVKPNLPCPPIEVLQRMLRLMVNDYKLQNVPIDGSQFFLHNSPDTSSENCLSAQKILVIDTTKVTVRQIMEFRKDKETMNKMRNFRLFAYEQYSGKDKAFVEDDIQKRLEDYNDAVKLCGFDTTIKTLSFLFESKFLVGTLATSVASLLMGNTQLAVEAFGAGAIVELGKLSLEYAKSKSEVRKICKENPISYIADAKKKIEAADISK